MAQLLDVGVATTREKRQYLVPARVRDRAGRLGDVTEDRQRTFARAAADHAELHRRQVLGLVDDDVAERGRRLPDERVGLVEEPDVAVAPALPAPAQEALLLRLQDPVPGLRQERGGREEGAHELLGRDSRPGAVEHPRQVPARAQRLLDLLSVPDRGPTQHLAIVGVERADEAHPEALARNRRRSVLLPGLAHELAHLSLADADVLALEPQQQLLRRALQLQLGGAGQHLGEPLVGLQPRDLGRVDERRSRSRPRGRPRHAARPRSRRAPAARGRRTP